MSSITSACSCQEALCSMLALCANAHIQIHFQKHRERFLQILSLQTPETFRMVSVSSHMRFSAETCFRAPTFNFFHLGGWPWSSLPLQVLSPVLQAAICCVGSGQVCLQQQLSQVSSVGGGCRDTGCWSFWGRFVPPASKQESILKRHFKKWPQRTKRLSKTQIIPITCSDLLTNQYCWPTWPTTGSTIFKN